MVSSWQNFVGGPVNVDASLANSVHCKVSASHWPATRAKERKKKKKKKESPLGHHRSFFPSSSFAFLVLLVAFLPLRFFRSHTPHTQRTQRSQPTTKGKGTASKWQAASGKVHVPRCQLVGKAQQQQRSSTVCCIRACTQNRFEKKKKKKQVCSAALPCRSLLLDSSVLCALCLVLCCMV